MTMPFDTLTFAHRLEEAGMDRRQSEALAHALRDVAMPDLVAKRDLTETKTELQRDGAEAKTELQRNIDEVKTELKHDIAEFRAELKHDIAELRTELKHDMAALRVEVKADLDRVSRDLTIRLGAMIGGSVGLATALLALLSRLHG